jgi:hypothetical protein
MSGSAPEVSPVCVHRSASGPVRPLPVPDLLLGLAAPAAGPAGLVSSGPREDRASLRRAEVYARGRTGPERLVERDEQLVGLVAAERERSAAALLANHLRQVAANTRNRAQRRPGRSRGVTATGVERVELARLDELLRWAGYARGHDGSWSLPSDV